MTNEELVYLYQNGDKQALEAILEKNKGIVNKLCNKFYLDGINSVDREDLEQEGYIGLITAADRYDFKNDKKAQFITYAIHWIYQRMNNYIIKRDTNKETSLNTPTGEDGKTELIDYIEGVDYSFENIEDRIYHKQLRQELEEVMDNYTTLKEREILKLHYGWDSNKCMTLEEIGDIFQVSGERIRQLKTASFRKIRNSPWGMVKAREVFIEKKRKLFYSIPGTIENMNFAERYLKDVM